MYNSKMPPPKITFFYILQSTIKKQKTNEIKQKKIHAISQIDDGDGL